MYLMEHLDDFEPQWIISNRAERKWPTIAYNMRSKKIKPIISAQFQVFENA